MLELQRHDVLRAEDLAATFETSVRTIYRDIQALSEAGVRVIGSPGQGYSLMEGYFLPPVSLTVDEAVTLLLGTDFIEQRFDAEYSNRARTSREKIEAILPEPVRGEASRVRRIFRLFASPEEVALGQEKAYLEVVRRAILEGRKIRFRYTKRIAEADGNRESVRTVEPYGILFFQGAWLLIARCELRQDIRHFRLSRIAELAELQERFKLPADFQLEHYRPPDDRSLRVRILVQPDIADKVKEWNNFYMESYEDHAEGLLVSLRVRQPEELLHWVLGWGSGVTVLEPESFRDRIRTEAAKMLKRY